MTQHGSRFDLKAIRRDLDAMRARHGANTEIGFHCSNLIEQLKNYPDLPTDRKAIMERFIAVSLTRLSALIKKET